MSDPPIEKELQQKLSLTNRVSALQPVSGIEMGDISPQEKVFADRNLIQNILVYATRNRNPMFALHLRTVTTLFNEEFIRLIRKWHRKIEVDGRYERFIDYPLEGYVMVQDVEMSIASFSNYCRFLTTVADQQVREFKFINTKNETDYTLHNIVSSLLERSAPKLKQVTGIDKICPDGCDRCCQYAKICEVYGPIQYKVYAEVLNQPRHFEMLCISDVLLGDIAMTCGNASGGDRAQCLKWLDIHIQPVITCKRLRLRLLTKEAPWAVPIEIFHAMIKTWKVEVIMVDVHDEETTSDVNSWVKQGFFKPFHLLKNFEGDIRPSFVLPPLEIILWNSPQALLSGSFDENEYSLMAANIQKVLPSQKVTLYTDIAACLEFMFMEQHIGNILRNTFCRNFTNNSIDVWSERHVGIFDECDLSVPLNRINRYLSVQYIEEETDTRYVFTDEKANFTVTYHQDVQTPTPRFLFI